MRSDRIDGLGHAGPNRGQFAREAGKTDRAISLLEKALNARPNDGTLNLALAEYYNRMGNSQKAAELAEKGKAHLTVEPSQPNQ